MKDHGGQRRTRTDNTRDVECTNRSADKESSRAVPLLSKHIYIYIHIYTHVIAYIHAYVYMNMYIYILRKQFS